MPRQNFFGTLVGITIFLLALFLDAQGIDAHGLLLVGVVIASVNLAAPLFAKVRAGLRRSARLQPL